MENHELPQNLTGLDDYTYLSLQVQEDMRRLAELSEGQTGQSAEALGRAGSIVAATESIPQKHLGELSQTVLEEIDRDKRDLARTVNILVGAVGAVGGAAAALPAFEGNYDAAMMLGSYTAGLMAVIKAGSLATGAVDRFQQWNQRRKQANLDED